MALINTAGFLSTGPIGISASQYDRTVSAHPSRLTADHRQWRRRIRVVRRQTGVETADTFDPPDGTIVTSPANTAVPGVSSAYHAATNSWLHLIRDANGQVLLVAWRAAPGYTPVWSNVVSLGFRSFATPSIACSPNRCFVTFVEVPSPLAWGSNQTRLQWTEGTVQWPTGGNLTFSYTAGVTTSWYNVFSDPVASVVQNPTGGWFYYVSTIYPESVAGTWGTRVLTYRRTEGSTGTGALTQITPLLPHSPGIATQPTAGATGVCAELFTSRSP